MNTYELKKAICAALDEREFMVVKRDPAETRERELIKENSALKEQVQQLKEEKRVNDPAGMLRTLRAAEAKMSDIKLAKKDLEDGTNYWVERASMVLTILEQHPPSKKARDALQEKYRYGSDKWAERISNIKARKR
jgi:hypothetical protein